MPWFVAQRTVAESRAYAVLANAPFDSEGAAREHARRWERETLDLNAARAEQEARAMVVFEAPDLPAARDEMGRWGSGDAR